MASADESLVEYGNNSPAIRSYNTSPDVPAAMDMDLGGYEPERKQKTCSLLPGPWFVKLIILSELCERCDWFTVEIQHLLHPDRFERAGLAFMGFVPC